MAIKYTQEEIKQITDNFGQHLGEGSFGQVFGGKLPDGRQVAVKRIIFSRKNYDKEWRHEKLMLETFAAHRNFIQYIGFGVDKIKQEGYLLMHWLNVSLRDVVNCNKDVQDEVTQWRHLIDVLAQITNALDHIHKTRIGTDRSRYVYGDMKPDNVMLQRTNQGYLVKIIDLGSISKEGSYSYTYTHGYAAPEILRGSGTSVKTDVYCLGMIMIDLLTRAPKSDKKRAEDENKMKKYKNKDKDASKDKRERAEAMFRKDEHIVSNWVKNKSGASVDALKGISALAMACTDGASNRRPNMREVDDRLRVLMG